MENAILFGNGLNRAGGNSFSWDNLLKSLSPLKEMPSDSNTHNYESIYLSACKKGSCKTKAGLVNEIQIKQQIAVFCQSCESNDFYENLVHLPSNILLLRISKNAMQKRLGMCRNYLCLSQSVWRMRNFLCQLVRA